jgi:N utilization substance protein B
LFIIKRHKTKVFWVINSVVAPENNESTVASRARTAARLAAVQAVYQMYMTDETPEKVVEEFIKYRLPVLDENFNLGAPDISLFRELALGTAKEIKLLDCLINDVLVEGWSSERLESTLHVILRVASYELKYHTLTPSAVVISEYIDVTHAFYDHKAVSLVNGVLDTISKKS